MVSTITTSSGVPYTKICAVRTQLASRLRQLVVKMNASPRAQLVVKFEYFLMNIRPGKPSSWLVDHCYNFKILHT